MSLIGAAICKWRELTGRKPIHDYKRVSASPASMMVTVTFSDPAAYGARRICTRCNHTVPVKKRVRRDKTASA